MVSKGVLWSSEFSRDFAVPSEVIKMVEQGILRDASYHHDSCPSFDRELPSGGRLILFVDHPDVGQREIPDHKRFAVCLDLPQNDNPDNWRDLLFTDDAAEAIEVVRQYIEQHPRTEGPA